MNTQPATALRSIVENNELVVVPTAYDALSARVIEETGFKVIHVGGFLGAGSLLGMPDIGLLTATEALERAANIANAVEVPIIADIDTGYGNAINVRRTIADCARAGIAGVHLEDQVFPKRCGQYGSGAMRLISAQEMVAKIHAVREAPGGDAIFLIARTDALGADLGVEEAVARMRAYADAGADAVLPITRSYEYLKECANLLDRDVPLVTAPTRFATIGADELRSAGYRIVFYTEIAARAALFQVRKAMRQLKDFGSVAELDDEMVPTEYLYEMVRLPYYRGLEDRYSALDSAAGTGAS